MSWKARLRATTLAGAVVFAGATVQAAQYAMVVGVDDYAAFVKHPAPAGQLSDLEGAVNDAERIAKAMRKMNIDLPQSRFLLDERATVDAFLKGWHEMIDRAAPGDTLIVTFSGHGGQEKETSEPFDEFTDKKDETIMFHDFDPKNPRRGRLSDDQLREILAEAAAYNVIWVMDSCHSAGLTRNVDPFSQGLTRNGGVWDIPIEPIEGEIEAKEGDDGQDELPHVTQILATASEDRLVTETRFEGKSHGALSWFFAEAITGAGDVDGDGNMTRAELAEYLEDRVFAHMKQNQQPRILPRGDGHTVFNLDGEPAPPPKIKPKPVKPPKKKPPKKGPPKGTVAIKFDGPPPPGLKEGSYFEVTTSPQLGFKSLGQGKWDVFNHVGDRITTITGDAYRLVARTKALDHILASKKSKLPAIRIEAGQDYSLNPIDAIVSYRFAPPQPDMGYLTLFNVASDGTLQYLHPLKPSGDKPIGPGGFPVRFRVTSPTGADQLVAIFCSRPPLDLRRDLSKFNGKLVPGGKMLPTVLGRGKCQTGIIGLYTEDG